MNRMTDDVIVRIQSFLEEASQIEGVTIDNETLSVIFDSDKERDVLALSDKYGIVDLTNRKHQ
ncbi:MAG: hypothetical protein K6G46_03265 [Prevotella sp.]|nr:hypothetical protein [Prevotella sp.]